MCSLMFFTHHGILLLQFSQAQISLSHLSSATSCSPPLALHSLSSGVHRYAC